MPITVSILADSISCDRFRVTSYYLKYPRFIHSELLTHRLFSRNSSSSRAVPTMKFLWRILKDPAGPTHWGENGKGMASKRQVGPVRRLAAKAIWRAASLFAVVISFLLYKLGIHKQVANRLLEPFLWMETVLTSETEGLENFFQQRCSPNAQPEMQALAEEMRRQRKQHVPEILAEGEWHRPFGGIDTPLEVSVARCARVSYLNFYGENTEAADYKLCKFLRTEGHWSPFEHVCMPGEGQGNLTGWITMRELLEGAN
jgi:thymidylate synthase ThyX